MAQVAEQCLPGRYNHAGHSPVCAWDEDCYVQWGSRGIVLRRNGGAPYETAFFEAFPAGEERTFIRGEGESVEAAERSAFAKLERYRACPGHEFERRNYTNGAGFCKHCGMFKSRAFDPTTLCTVCVAPTDYSVGCDAEGKYHWYCEEHEHLRPRDKHPNLLDRLQAPD